MSALALSVLLSLVSAVAYAAGAIVQERVAASSTGVRCAPLRRPAWWAAVGLNGLGGLLHVVALAYGPLSVVQPLGALTIVFALPMAALFVGRRAGATAWRGAVMATVGLAGLLSLVGASDARSLDTAQRVTVAVVTAVALVTLMIAGRAAQRHPAVRSVLLATASGIAFGMSSVFTKTVAVDWTGGVSAADLPSLAVIGVLATAGMLLSQASYRGAGLAAPLAVLTVANPVVAAVVGITMFGEAFRYGTTGTALALSCGVVAAGGLILLTTERLAREAATGVDAEAVPDGAVSGGGAGAVSYGVVSEAEAACASAVTPAVGAVPGRPVTGLPVAVEPAPRASVAIAPVLHEPVIPASVEVPGVTGTSVAVAGPAEGSPAGGGGAQPLAARPAKVFLPRPAPVPAAAPAGEAYAAPEPAVPAAEDRIVSYGPFYGGPYVPLPVLGRRRVRIRS
ncbi:DMT family transporter [Streptomyces flaveolus]|uniref:DMT family transporter n=1 Tax=Streptomyces flaveolus TaxID=67297 RepID=UPI0036FD88CA